MKIVLLFFTTLGVVLFSSGQDIESDAQRQIEAFKKMPPHEPSPYFFTTPKYRQEAFRVLLEEVNKVASELQMNEPSPITTSNLTEIFIATPGSAALGRISTSNYSYMVPIGMKFRGLNALHQEKLYRMAKEKYYWPKTRIDTNAAFHVANKLMKKAGMDVDAMNRECKISVEAPSLDENTGKTVPAYWVVWRKSGETVAQIQFLLPTEAIWALQVWTPIYNLRKPVEIPHLREILIEGHAPESLLKAMGLEQTNSPSGTNASTPQKP